MKCVLCPRKCLVNRKQEPGFCGCTNEIKVARCAKHYFEEPILVGDKGSGAIFFSGCNLKCVFCQNYAISHDNFGKIITVEELAQLFLKLQKEKALNINLVTPTPYVFEIKKALIIAKEKGLTLPVIYNTSSYEDVKTIKLLKGFIDIYLPDLKYFDDLLAIKFSKAPNYFYYATNAIKEMVLQVGKPLFDSDGNLIKGVIVRHLVLPNHTDDSKKIIKYLYDTYHDDIFISIMNQYTPLIKTEDSDLNRCLTKHEYNKVVNYAISLGVTNAFIQDEGTNKTSFIPPFDLEGV